MEGKSDSANSRILSVTKSVIICRSERNKYFPDNNMYNSHLTIKKSGQSPLSIAWLYVTYSRYNLSGLMGRARSELLAPANGAGNEGRTRDLKLGKLALCQLSYTRVNPFYPSRTSAIKHNNQILSRSSTSTAKRSNDLAVKQESLMLCGPTI